MTKTVRVTPAQVDAAKLKLKRSAATGRFVSPSVIAIASAKRGTDASGDSAHRGKAE